MNVKNSEFVDFFAAATESRPYPYQASLATGGEFPHLVDVPTGIGKTAAVVLAWLFRRRFHPDETIRNATPRRLVYCLPMRTLVEQTYVESVRWLDRLGLIAGKVSWDTVDEQGLPTRSSQLKTYTPDPDDEREPSWAAEHNDLGTKRVAVHLLTGGEEQTDWDLHPERDAILIGTQDMLLSRALNRGYGMSRYRWPMHFALLNNDCLWVFDELQLMDTGVATTAQLAGFRQKLETSLNTHTLWMSATLDPAWLNTVDFPDSLGETRQLEDDDRQIEPVKQRLNAPKLLHRADAIMGDAAGAAETIESSHEAETRTLAVFNTVKRAVEVYKELKKQKPAAKLVLIHSRFRQPDRDKKMKQLLADPPPEGIIAITTQVVEAGVDVSAKTLFTEVAPWSSLVQRFGRCNRAGEFTLEDPARVIWFDLPDDEKERDKVTNPYELDDLLHAREQLQHCENVGPTSLSGINLKMRLDAPHVIRRRDLLDLFDTTPDLAGNDIDISRFIRTGDEFDVQVFWREWDQPKGYEPPPNEKTWRRVNRDELCTAPVSEFRKFASDPKRRAMIWRWDALDGHWVQPDKGSVHPGQTYLIHSGTGGYDPDLGWVGTSSKKKVQPFDPQETDGFEDDTYDGEAVSQVQVWQSIAEHTNDVVHELDRILEALTLDAELRPILNKAARWHDWGKAHPAFVAKFKSDQLNSAPFKVAADSQFLAKAPDEAWYSWAELRKLSRQPESDARPHFRHELASALAMLKQNMDDLAVYIVAAHHGKVRLSIRSLPGERTPDDDPTKLFARGIWEGDSLPQTDLGDGVKAPPLTLSLESMQLGRSQNGDISWAARMLNLRDKHGPFRLAFLEALLRAADMRASAKAGQRTTDKTEPES